MVESIKPQVKISLKTYSQAPFYFNRLEEGEDMEIHIYDLQRRFKKK